MRPRRLRRTPVIVAISAGLLALPGVASATVTTTANAAARTLDVTSNGASEGIDVRVGAGGTYLVNGTDSGLLAAADIAIAVDGGEGDDSINVDLGFDNAPYGRLTVHGGGGRDRIDVFGPDRPGAAIRDQLFGDDGNDFITTSGGDRDGFGGNGDDQLELFATQGAQQTTLGSSGDGGSDTLAVIVVASSFDSAQFTIRPGAGAGHVAVHSVVGGDGVVDIDGSTVEQLEIHGNDDAANTIVGADGLAALLSGGMTLTGGDEDDSISGGDTADTILGGDGEDKLTGGGGSDLLQGANGNDTIASRDGFADLVRGGGGDDSAAVDGRDTVDAVEHLDVAPSSAPPAPPVAPSPDVKALAATVASGKVKLTRARGKLLARVPVSCPAAETGGCAATLTLQTAKPVKLGRLRGVLTLGAKRVSLKAGQRATATFTFATAVTRLARKGRLSARASIVSRDAAGNVATSSRSLGLLVPRPPRKGR